MQINDLGLKLIKDFEGFKPKAYKDLVGKWTIGYGFVKGVKPGDIITKEEADEELLDTLKLFEIGVETFVDVPLTGNQFSALVCLAYNVGLGNLKGSTLLKKLNSKDYAGAAEQFQRWNRAGGEVVSGLTRRRNAERLLFLTA